jgi:hypothetical protein
MQWIYHNAPGGEADGWVVEAKNDSTWRIIGHHALCPVRFTLGNEEFLCAKTFNSFLLPEFRDRFLYLRFEMECLREADLRFDATFSLGQGASRLRSAFGYTNFGNWIQFERGFQPVHIIFRTLAYQVGRHSYPARVRLSRALAAITAVPVPEHSLALEELSAIDAVSSTFFVNFWTEARTGAGMAPRRDRADLEWRFWRHPSFTGSTLTYTSAGSRAYFIVDTRDPLLYSLTDFFIAPADARLFADLLDALFAWCAQRGALALKFRTVAEGLPAPLLEVLFRKMKLFALQRFVPILEMPRRFSASGISRTRGIPPSWNTTEFLAVDSF